MEEEKRRLEDEKNKKEEANKKKLEEERERIEEEKKKQVEERKRKNEDEKRMKEEENKSKELLRMKEQENERINQEVQKQQQKEEEKKLQKEKENTSYEFNSLTNPADFAIRNLLDNAENSLYILSDEEVLKMCEEILKKYPKSPRANFLKAEILIKMAEEKQSNSILEQGITQYQKVLDLPDVPYALLVDAGTKLAEKQIFRGWNGKATKTWRFLSDKYPNDVKLKNKLGVSYLMANQNEEARKTFEKVLEMDHGDGLAKVHLGFIIKTIDNDPEKALPFLIEGVASEAEGTKDGRFYFHLGDAFQRLNLLKEAYKVYKTGAENGLFLSSIQRSLYNVNTLTGRPWWTAEETGYTEDLKLFEESWKVIRDEGMAQLDAKTGGFTPESENLREKGEWKQFVLYQRGQKNKKNCEKAPKTCELIDRMEAVKTNKRGQVKFSVIHPGTHIWPHCGPTNCRLRAHLGLKVPTGINIRVGQEKRTWKEGKFIIFDDSFEHEVWHNGNELRLVLIVDFWHPDLTEEQKKTLSPI
ncbi:ASPH [Mytilus edulis]|uniref:ASPH n=1 Tax=Mytilus edulis TaxID=6550 RepID=A0A8S3U8U7_MYTED|nr:ASPH [Mytilus edulis]